MVDSWLIKRLRASRYNLPSKEMVCAPSEYYVNFVGFHPPEREITRRGEEGRRAGRSIQLSRRWVICRIGNCRIFRGLRLSDWLIAASLIWHACDICLLGKGEELPRQDACRTQIHGFNYKCSSGRQRCSGRLTAFGDLALKGGSRKSKKLYGNSKITPYTLCQHSKSPIS